MKAAGAWTVVLAFALGGCVPATPPHPATSAIVAPLSWRDSPAADNRIDPRWWRSFGDPYLNWLVETALVRNTDVLTAAAAVEASRAQLRLARSALLPTLDAMANVTRSGMSAKGMSSAQTTAMPGVEAAWEIDLFGRLRALTAAARLRYQASQADRDAMALSVASQVCQAYFDLTAQDLQLAVTRETLQSRIIELRLIEDQERHGYVSKFEVTQARAEQETIAQQVPVYEQGVRADENALSVLVGQLPQGINRIADFRAFEPPPIPSTLPSALLRRRPDIASAEYDLAAADAVIAARRADFLPQLNLMGMFGYSLSSAPAVPAARLWSVGGSILAPLFEGGALHANLDLAVAERDQAAFAYKAAVLEAFDEVETSLSAARSFEEQIRIARERRATLKESIAHAVDRYREGYSTYLDQLDTQRNFYASQIAAVTVRRDQLSNLASLFVALGGGWSDEHVSTSIDNPPPSQAVQPYASSPKD
ncbi:efflux transporter outer membrane subunit [Sphingomonas bacterium]|uniref:efflux transporter outer membrane subunit n=1 Tax=Sphingomonas bacterium TaxID=1895847 RepID=UPI001576C23E|nr:efflux transporter outer membrane subunit [Sphingomonas bacterium]